MILGLVIVGLVTSLLASLLALVNIIFAAVATIAVWKSYLLTGIKIFYTLLILVPIVGILVYFFWGQKKVRDAK